MKTKNGSPRISRWMASFGLLATTLGSIGCQIDVAGQTLPSPYYIYDDVQYFPAGPEFKLSREAAEMKKAKAQSELGEL